ncbi:MAG: aminotransferase class I/II-fold pyridoxal phosphate-dependent enzyme [Caldilineaceae bacterium]
MSHPFSLHPTLAAHLTPSPTLLINERVTQLWAEGKTVFHLGFGESRFPVHPKLAAALQANIHQTSYLATQGLAELRSAAASFYTKFVDIPTTADRVMVASGSKPLLWALQMALDADLILPTPSWVSYAPQARLLQRKILRIPAGAANRYALTVEALEKTVRQSDNPSKLLLLNSPSNPGGWILEPKLVKEICDFCRQEQILIGSDEIYALTAHGVRPHASPAHYYPEGTVVFGGLSKHLSLGGWRLGVAVLPSGERGKLLLQGMKVIAGEIWSSPAAPIQYAAISAYNGDPEIMEYIATCARLHAIRTNHLWSWLNEYGVPCPEPQGAFYLFPNFDPWKEALAKKGVHTSDDLARYLLDEVQIATLPGTAFGVPAEELSLRLATSYVDMETEEKAANLLAAWQRDPDPSRLIEGHHPVLQQTIERIGAFLDGLHG